MGIFARLETLLKSYLSHGGSRTFSHTAPRDPDLEAAYEELNDLLGHGGPFRGRDTPNHGQGNGSEPRTGGAARTGNDTAGKVPEELRPDFAELGLPFGASAEDCKGAYKKLLNIHHPDRHAGHAGNFRKATAKSARINAAYDRIEKWRTGRN
ncbi:MAG: J domain-containing protein [Spirochaetaceae bacterium]|jgi:DnaJ-domain-containing protein 1|nr:J domain-containing protein [Spirochaetaceae bacterium]